MVNTIHDSFDRTMTNTMVKAAAIGTILLSTSAGVIPYTQVPNTVAYHQQKNASLDFSSIDRLKRDFFITDAVENFLRYNELTDILITAEQHIRDYFPTEKLILDADKSEPGRILLLIQTDLSVSEASKRLDALDEAWIIDHIDELKNIIIDVMFT